MQRRTAMTILELLVATSIGTLLVGIVLLAFLQTGRLLSWVGARSDASSGALLAVTQLSRELRSSTLDSVTIASTTLPGPALMFQIETPDLTQALTPNFQAAPYAVVYYFDAAQHVLVRKTWPASTQASPSPTPPPSGLRMQAADLQTVLSTPNGTEHTLATGVQAFLLTPSTYPNAQPVTGVSVTVEVQKSVDSTQVVAQSVTTALFPRNQP